MQRRVRIRKAVGWLIALLLVGGYYNAVRQENLGQEMMDAIWAGDAGKVQTLLNRGANPNVRRDRKDKIRGVLKVLLDPLDRNGGWTALMVASMQNQLAIIDALVKQGADVNAVGWVGATPLTLAIKDGHPDAVRALIRHGGRINQVGHFGNTPLMVSVDLHHGSLASLSGTWMAKLLLDSGAEIDARGVRGRTALIVAAKCGNSKAVRLLLQRGANPSLRDTEGWTALKHAQENGHTETAALLTEPGAIYLSDGEPGRHRQRSGQ